MDVTYTLISLLNGLSVGLLLFMLASGLTLIFSMMGVLNFAHASFYMLGAYVAYTLSNVVGFWWALLLAPPLVGLLGALFERHALRRVHKFGHVPELLITFGLSYILLEIVQLVWGRSAVNFLPPESLSGPLFTIVDLPSGLSIALGDKPHIMNEVAEIPTPANMSLEHRGDWLRAMMVLGCSSKIVVLSGGNSASVSQPPARDGVVSRAAESRASAPGWADC